VNVENQVKVSQYATEIINNRPYKYQTRQTLIKDLKRLGVWDLNVSQINSSLIRNIVERVTTQSTRKRLFITARTIFKDLGVCQDLPYLEAEGKIYDIPKQEHLEWLIAKSKYRLQLLLCMYGGLRVGEACAVTPDKLQGNYLDVNQAYSQDGLADEVKNMSENQFWKIGMSTKMVTNSCYKLSRGKKWKSMTGGKSVNPHMLRHWYATDMIRRGVNPEVVRRQMRHKNVSVTLKIYTQVRSEEVEASLPDRIVLNDTLNESKVVQLRLVN
jgi:integrase